MNKIVYLKKYKYIIILVVMPFLLLNSVIAQTKKPILVFGLESSMRYSHIFDDVFVESLHGLEFGINIERPLFNKFSFGIGITKSNLKFFSDFEPIEIAPDYAPHLLIEVYKVDINKMSNTSIPLKLIYRLPCNCIFFNFNYVPEFLKIKQERSYLTRYPTDYRDEPNFQNLRRRNDSIEIGFGFKFHFKTNSRVILRTELKKYLNSFYFNEPKKLASQFVKFTLGYQWAILNNKE